MKKVILLCFVLFQFCSSIWIGYDIMYFDGSKKQYNKFIQELEQKKIKYKVIKHDQNIYEVQYKDLNKQLLQDSPQDSIQ